MKKYLIKHIAGFLTFFFIGTASFAKEIPTPSIKPAFTITSWSSVAPDQENFSGSDIIRLSLRFGLTEPDSEIWKNSLLKYKEMVDRLKTFKNLSEIEKGEKIMEVMYESALSNYRIEQTKLDVMFEKGTYNCVSSSLLYLALAKDWGLDARVQETSKHAFITIYTKDGQQVDVETTNPQGFNPGTRKMVTQNSTGSKKYTIVPKNYYSNRNEISDRKAVTLVAKNLCSFMNDRNDYQTSVPLAVSVYMFVEREKNLVRQDMDALCANYAAYANKTSNFEQALDFLESIYDAYGASDILEKNYNNIAYNSAAQNCNANNFEAAWDNYNRRKPLLTEKDSAEINAMIWESEVLYKAQALEGDEGIACVQQYRKDVQDPKLLSQLERIEEIHWSKKIVPYLNREQYLEAVQICDKAIQSLPKSSYLKNTKSVCYSNHGVKVHNQVVPLINARKYNEALDILNEAAQLNPQNSLIKKDIDAVLKLIK